MARRKESKELVKGKNELLPHFIQPEILTYKDFKATVQEPKHPRVNLLNLS